TRSLRDGVQTCALPICTAFRPRPTRSASLAELEGDFGLAGLGGDPALQGIGSGRPADELPGSTRGVEGIRPVGARPAFGDERSQIGRASCRERGEMWGE